MKYTDCSPLVKKFIIASIALLLLVGLVYGFKTIKSKFISGFIAKMTPKTVQVTAATVGEAFWKPEIQSIGSVRASEGVDIASELSGRVTNIYFVSGQIVKAGDPLIQLNPKVLEAQLKSRITKFNYAKVSYERQLSLYKSKLGQKSVLDEKHSAMDEAQAAMDETQARLNQLLISAPFSGVLGLRHVDLGQYVSPGQVLVNLQSTATTQVDFSVPEVLLGKMSVGLPVTISALPYPKKSFSGKIIAVNSQINKTSRSLSLRATVDNQQGLLLPDMFVSIIVHLKGGQAVIVIPQIAVNYSQIGDYVYTVKDGKAVKTYVTLGERRASDVSVLKGLSPGDKLVTSGALKLRDGAAVTVVPESGAKKTS